MLTINMSRNLYTARQYQTDISAMALGGICMSSRNTVLHRYAIVMYSQWRSNGTFVSIARLLALVLYVLEGLTQGVARK